MTVAVVTQPKRRTPARQPPVQHQLRYMAGDWYCKGCGDHQFAKNSHCRWCGTEREAAEGNVAPPRKSKHGLSESRRLAQKKVDADESAANGDLEVPPGLEAMSMQMDGPPPGLALPALGAPDAPPGLEGLTSEMDVAATPSPIPEGYQVLLRNFPDLWMHDFMIREMLEEADLGEHLTGVTTRPGGKVLLTFSAYDSVVLCIQYFNGQVLPGSWIPIIAIYVKIAGKTPVTPRADVKAKGLNEYAPAFVPSACFGNAGAIEPESDDKEEEAEACPTADEDPNSDSQCDATAEDGGRPRTLSACAAVFVPAPASEEKKEEEAALSEGSTGPSEKHSEDSSSEDVRASSDKEYSAV